MKKSYETPSVEKIKFNYRDQVVAASGSTSIEPQTGETEREFFRRLLADGISWSDIVEIWNRYVG